MQANLEPYKLWKKFTMGRQIIRVVISDMDIFKSNCKTHREYIALRLKEEFQLVCTRWYHNYDSLSGNQPLFGPVYMRTDSDINPGLEVWFIPGHNTRELHNGI